MSNVLLDGAVEDYKAARIEREEATSEARRLRHESIAAENRARKAEDEFDRASQRLSTAAMADALQRHALT